MMWFGRYRPGPYGHYGLWHLGGAILWLILLGLLGALLVMLLRRRDSYPRAGTSAGTGGDVGAGPAPSPLDVAKMRYARGELTREEFEALKKDLE
ncbi:MAG TPA: SHOCT domain-containing protein [Actinomycetota bacterium]